MVDRVLVFYRTYGGCKGYGRGDCGMNGALL